MQCVQDIRVENGIGALLTGDDGHVAIVFCTGVPNVRNNAVCLGVLGDFTVEEGAALQVELEVCGVGNLAGALDGAEFTDDYRNALVAEHRLEFAECLCNLVRSAESGVVDALAVNVPAHVVFLVIRAGKSGVVIILLAPVFVSGHERVLIRVVVDFGHHVAFASRVGRPACAEHRSIVHFGTRSLHDQGAGVVVAACATHRSDECIVVALQNLHTGVVECPLTACAPRVVHARFVGACEEKVLVIVFKIRCNLSPECGLASLDGC